MRGRETDLMYPSSRVPIVRAELYSFPVSIMQQYKNITLSADIMKVTGIPFSMTISRHLKFGFAGNLDNMENITTLKHFKVTVGVYAIHGFKAATILADNQFESMRVEIADMSVLINIVSRDEHVPKIERYNRTIKERVQAQYNVLPFEHYLPIFMIEMVYSQVFWCNMFALKGCISATQSPFEIILNHKLNYNAHCMATRTVGAISTHTTGNTQDRYYCIRLDMGCCINHNDWAPLPMPKEVVDQVHRLGRRAKAKKKLIFTNRNNKDLDVLYAALSEDDDAGPTNDKNDSLSEVNDAEEADSNVNEDSSN